MKALFFSQVYSQNDPNSHLHGVTIFAVTAFIVLVVVILIVQGGGKK